MTVARVMQYRISTAVDHDMMLIGDDDGEIEVFMRLEQHPRARDRVFVHQDPFRVGQFPGLGEHFEGNLDLANVVQQPGHAEGAHVRRGQGEELRQCHRQHRDVHRVRRGVLVEFFQLQQR